MNKTDKDQALRQRVLMTALVDAPFDGFTPALLSAACKTNKVDLITQARLFPADVMSLVAAFSEWADAQMSADIDTTALRAMKIRARFEHLVLKRLDVLRPHKEAARRAGAFLSLPMHAALAAKLIWRSVDVMWQLAGDHATDFNFYSKRAILTGVYGATLVRWFNDDSEDEAPTKAFLARRINDVMRFESFKAELKRRFEGAPPPGSASRRRRRTRA